MLALTPFHQTLLACLVPGLLAGAGLAAWGGRRPRLTSAVTLLVLGVGSLWGALVAGVGYGYAAWQRLPDPPDEAFSDGGKLIAVLLLGWLPAGFVCGPVFVLVRAAARRASRSAEAPTASGASGPAD